MSETLEKRKGKPEIVQAEKVEEKLVAEPINEVQPVKEDKRKTKPQSPAQMANFVRMCEVRAKNAEARRQVRLQAVIDQEKAKIDARAIKREEKRKAKKVIKYVEESESDSPDTEEEIVYVKRVTKDKPKKEKRIKYVEEDSDTDSDPEIYASKKTFGKTQRNKKTAPTQPVGRQPVKYPNTAPTSIFNTDSYFC
jgi:hypothetical protein